MLPLSLRRSPSAHPRSRMASFRRCRPVAATQSPAAMSSRISAACVPASHRTLTGSGCRAVFLVTLRHRPPGRPGALVRLPAGVSGHGELFGSFAGKTVPYALIVCYPTDPANPRADYVLPTGNVVPHMQRGAEAPIFPAGDKRWPVVLYSHGLSGSPISGDYIESVKQIASYGYVTIGVFHGDLRFADIDLDGSRGLRLRAAALPRFRRDAGGAPAVALVGTRCRPEPSRLPRSRRSRQRRRLRREPRRRVAAADGGRAAHDVARPIVDARHAGPAAQGRGRLRPVLRHRRLSGVRPRSQGPRRNDAALSRDRRHRRHHGTHRGHRATACGGLAVRASSLR